MIHSSEDIKAETIFADLLRKSKPKNDSGLSVVAFVLARQQDGSESLSKLAEQDSIPQVASKYDDAHCIHHHVSGVLNANTFTRDASRASAAGHNVVEVSLAEFASMKRGDVAAAAAASTEEMEVADNGAVVASKTSSRNAKKRARKIANAHVLIVNVEASAKPEEIDAAVVSAIENKSIESVVLSSVRSVAEVKQERELDHQRRLKFQEEAGRKLMQSKRRRLEDADQQGEAEEDAQDDEDLEGVVYVSMTPNILAGLLFFFLFVMITYVGIGCMGMIAGQDVYVKKMPTIGREA